MRDSEFFDLCKKSPLFWRTPFTSEITFGNVHFVGFTFYKKLQLFWCFGYTGVIKTAAKFWLQSTTGDALVSSASLLPISLFLFLQSWFVRGLCQHCCVSFFDLTILVILVALHTLYRISFPPHSGKRLWAFLCRNGVKRSRIFIIAICFEHIFGWIFGTKVGMR